MATLILATTNDAGGTARVYLGQTQSPNTLSVVATRTEVFERVAINPIDNSRMAVAGNNALIYSTDGGVTWNDTAYFSPLPLRSLQWTAANKLRMATRQNMFVSTDDGATLTGVPSTFNGVDIMDMHWWNDSVGYAITNGTTTGGFLYYTIDGGATWEEYTLPSLFGWDAAESPRRVFVSRYNGVAPNRIHLLTSHRVWRIEHSPTAIVPGVSATLEWDYEPVVQGIFTSYPPTGYVGLSDENNRFDHIEVRGNRVWLGGYNALRGHSFAPGTFYLTEVSAATATPDLNAYYTHSAFDANRVFAGSSQPGSSLFPFRPGLNFSFDGGVSIAPFQLFSGNERLAHHEVFADEEDAGCTDPDACNYKEEPTIDDGSCLHAVQLVDCLSSQVLHTNTPEISHLRCRGPRMAINIQLLDPLQPAQTIQIIRGSAVIVNYTAYVSPSGTPADRLNEFIGGLIQFINSTTTYRASRIPPAQNQFVVGSLGGVWITTTDASAAGAQTQIPAIGLLGVEGTIFDNGSTGSIVRVAEYPERCFRVCGPGNCAIVQPLTLVSVYNNCSACIPSPPSIICIDCTEQLRIGTTPVLPALSVESATCVTAGDILDITVRVSFPDRAEELLIPNEEGIQLSTNCQVTLTFPGDVTEFFPVGSTFTITDDASGVYTVATAVYFPETDTTTVVTSEVYSGTGLLQSVSSYTTCDCRARVIIERVVNPNSDSPTFTTLSDTTFYCVDGQVEEQMQCVIPDHGVFRVRIQSIDCAYTRECVYWMSACENFRIRAGVCHEFFLDMNRRDGAPLTGELFNVVIRDITTNELLINEQIEDSEFPANIIADQDSIYMVTVTSVSSGRVWQTEIVDLCDLQKCRKKLTIEQLCEEDPCEPTVTTQQQQLRSDELNRISILGSTIEAQVHNYRYRYLGIPTYTNERMLQLQELATAVSVVRKVSARCAQCDQPAQTETPCSNC